MMCNIEVRKNYCGIRGYEAVSVESSVVICIKCDPRAYILHSRMFCAGFDDRVLHFYWDLYSFDACVVGSSRTCGVHKSIV